MSKDHEANTQRKRIPELKPVSYGFSESFMQLRQTNALANAVFHIIAQGQDPVKIIEELVRNNIFLSEEAGKLIEKSGMWIRRTENVTVEGILGLPKFVNRKTLNGQ